MMIIVMIDKHKHLDVVIKINGLTSKGLSYFLAGGGEMTMRVVVRG